MIPSRRSWWWLGLTVAFGAGAGGCASEESRVEFPTDGEKIEIVVHGDGFVVWKDSRMPVEGLVLRIRQHMRELSKEQRNKVVVEVRYTDGFDAATHEWLTDQFYLMGVGWFRVLS